LFIGGVIANIIGSILIGLWLVSAVPSPGNDAAWWGCVFTLACSIGIFWLFNYSGNKLLKALLATLLAIIWGFVGNALATLVGAGTHIGFLPDPDVMSVLFLIGSFGLHLWITFRRV
jgi:hypothetical protein